MGELFLGYVMASEFAGWNTPGEKTESIAKLEGAKQHANGKYKSLIETMGQMHDLGYSGIEVAPFTVGIPLDYARENHEHTTKTVRSLTAQDMGAVTGLHWILSFLNAVTPAKEGLSIFTENKMRETHAYYKLLIDYCADLGGTYMVHGSPPSRVPEPHQSEKTMEIASNFFKGCGDAYGSQTSLVEYAKKRKVKIGFEPLGTGETSFINTVQEGLDLAEIVNHPNFGITIDVKAMVAEGKGQSVPSIIRSIGRDNVDKIVAVHFNDPSLTGPRADGIYEQADWEYIMGALAEIGWDGLITIEPFKQYGGSILDNCKQIFDFLTMCEKNVAGK